MSRSFANVLLLAFATGLHAQDGAVPPLEGTVIRRLGNANWRSAVELHAPAFSPAGDALARLRRVRVERQEEKPTVDRHGDPLPRTNPDRQSAVTLPLAIWRRSPDAPAQCGQAVSDASRVPRRSVAGVLGASAGVRTTRSGAADWLLFDSARIAYTVAPRRTLRGRGMGSFKVPLRPLAQHFAPAHRRAARLAA